MEPGTIEDILARLDQRPEDAELQQELGDLYFQQGDLMKAWKAYMQSLRLNPYDLFTCLKFGALLMICEDKKYSQDSFERAIALEPELAVAHWSLGNLYRKKGDYGLAEQS
jgi:tetratricopeptide (TPR) repeat protein